MAKFKPETFMTHTMQPSRQNTSGTLYDRMQIAENVVELKP
jgi:hypothetical protein